MARRYKECFYQAMASKVIHIPATLIPRSKVQFLRALDLTTSRYLSTPSQRTSPSSKIDVTEIKEPVGGEIQEINEQHSKSPALSSSHQVKTVKPRTRTIPPFIFSHDVPRGVLYAAQMLISYLLMLAIMSVFQTRLSKVQYFSFVHHEGHSKPLISYRSFLVWVLGRRFLVGLELWTEAINASALNIASHREEFCTYYIILYSTLNLDDFLQESFSRTAMGIQRFGHVA